jgi:hypothetical protein
VVEFQGASLGRGGDEWPFRNGCRGHVAAAVGATEKRGQVRTGAVDVDNFLPERTAQANSVTLPYPTFNKPHTFDKMDSLGGAGMSAFQNDPYVFASEVATHVAAC